MNDISQTFEATRHARDQLFSDFHNLATHAEELLQATRSASGEGINAAREKLNQSLQDARGQLQQAQQYAKDRAGQALSSADSYVHAKPWQAIAVAAFVGLILGLVGGARRG